VEGKFLSGRSAGGKDVAVLRGTSFNHRDQLYVPSHSGRQNDRQLETTDTGAFSLCPQGTQKITHFAKLRDCADTLRYFNDVVSGLGEKLGPVLFQLPPNFKKDTFVLGDFVNGLPGGMRAAFEFRHESWFDDEVFETLKAREAALCIADTEKLETPKVATAKYGYLRLRREDYSKIDIERWVEFVRQQHSGWDDVFIYFKHEEAGIGPKLATQMVELLA